MGDILAAIGEALIDFIPAEKGCEFYEVSSFSPAVGGAPANCCGAYSKLGGRSTMITQLGLDPFGDKIIRELSSYGIGTEYIAQTDRANTALAFVSLAADGNRTFSFYRKPSADMLYSPEQLDEAAFENLFALHFCSVSLGDFPMKQAHIRAIELASQNGAIVSFDPNLRFQLWDDIESLKKMVLAFIPLCHILKISDEELEFITGCRNIEEALDTLFTGSVQLIVYTCGKNGAYAYTKSAHAYSPTVSVNAADTTGAGDGFIGSFLWKLHQTGATPENIRLLTSEEMGAALDFSNKFCALSVQKKGAIASYPTLDQINRN